MVEERRHGELIAALCGRFRDWAPAEPRAPAPGPLLPGGLSNHTQLLLGSEARYVLRIAGSEPPAGVDRERELRVHRLAAGRGLAPPVLHADPARGILITPFLGEALAAPPGPRELAAFFHAVHVLPVSGRAQEVLDARSALEDLLAALPRGHDRSLLSSPDTTTRATDPDSRARDTAVAQAMPALRSLVATVLALQPPGRSTRTGSPVLCHNDLLRENLRRAGGELLALDWEYAAPGDPFFDLAVSASQYDDAGAAALLAHYLGRSPAPAERERYARQRLLYAAIDACWRALYAPAGAASALAGLETAIAATAGN